MTNMKNAFGIVFVAFLIAACTPPMPPEFKAELAERYVTCAPGEVSVASTPELAEITQTWIDGLQENCGEMSVAMDDPEVDIETQPNVFILSPGQIPTCDVIASSPVGLDAVAVAVSVEGLDGVIFSPALLHRALSGGMTSWADPELQELNPDIGLTDSPVVLRASTRPQDVNALNEWMKRVDPVAWPADPSGLIADPAFDSEAVTSDLETEGMLAVVPASFATNNSLQTIGIQIEQEPEPVFATVESVISAGTQMVASAEESNVTAILDASISPVPAAGNDVASLPWQAVNLFTINVCSGANEMAGRAFARFALRLDSQGAMTTFGFTETPEQVRLVAVDAVSQGLPEPSIPPSDAPEGVVTEEPLEEATDLPSEVPTEVPLVEVTTEATPEPTS